MKKEEKYKIFLKIIKIKKKMISMKRKNKRNKKKKEQSLHLICNLYKIKK